MNIPIKFALLILTIFLAGCSNSADKIAQGSLDYMKELTEAFEKGDKERAMSAAKKLQALLKEGKDKKFSEADNKRIEEKYRTQMQDQMKKMMTAMGAAVSSGKFSQADLKEIGAVMQQMR